MLKKFHRITHKISEKTNNTLVCERLLLEDDLTSEKAVILASQIDSASQCSTKSNLAHESRVSSGDMLQECIEVHRAEADRSLSADIQYAYPQVQHRCGNHSSTRHSSRAHDCPAWGKTCRRCRKLNHICHSAPVQAPTHRNPRANATTTAIIHSINTNSVGFSSFTVKGVVHFKKKQNKKKLLLIIYSPPCHPRCPCLSFFRRKEIKVFDEALEYIPSLVLF